MQKVLVPMSTSAVNGYDCPKCKQPKGEPCRTPKGRELLGCHTHQQRTALISAEERKLAEIPPEAILTFEQLLKTFEG